jgi:DNA-binding protein Fis
MKACKGNKSKAAKILGITRKALYSRLKEIEAMGAELKFD